MTSHLFRSPKPRCDDAFLPTAHNAYCVSRDAGFVSVFKIKPQVPREVSFEALNVTLERPPWEPSKVNGNHKTAAADNPAAYTVNSRYLEVDGTIFYKFKLPEVQINLHFG